MLGLRRVIRNWCYGKMWCQPLFERLHSVALGGMNYGNVDCHDNGEVRLLQELSASIPEGVPVTILDVGANCGQYAAEVRRFFGERALIHCFEPSPVAFSNLARVLGGKTGVTLHNFGLGGADGTSHLHCESLGGTGSSVYRREIPEEPNQVPFQEEIKLRTLDGVCEDHRIESVYLLKCDVEGGELAVLQGAKKTLSRGAVKFIQFEVGVYSVFSRTFLRDIMLELGDRYEVFRVLRDGLRPVGAYSFNSEIFVTSNYLARLRADARPGLKEG